MAIPAEIARLLGAEPGAHAALGCGLHGPIGETHLVVAHGQLHLFTRESLVGEFTQALMAGLPKLEPGDFSDTLHVELSDGTSADLSVSSFDRDAVKHALNSAAEAATAQPPVPQPEAQVEPQPTPAQPVPTPLPTATAVDPQVADKGEDEDKAPDDEQADKEDAVYLGGEVGVVPCLSQLLLFAGAVVGLWFLHDRAVIGLYGPGVLPDDGFIYISTKALAIVAGMYAGAKLAGLITRLRKIRNWSGRVEITRRSVLIVGKDNRWRVSIDTSRPFELLSTHVVNPEGSRATTAGTNRNEYWYYIRLSQQGHVAALRFLRYGEEPLRSLAGLPVTPGQHDMPEARTLRMDERTCLQVAARLKKLYQPFARRGSTGDNAFA